MKDYKNKYKQALERARVWKEKSGMPINKQGILDDIFPELKEIEDERIRKWLIKAMKCLSEKSTFFLEVPKDKVIAWLEKQGKKIDVIKNFDTEFEKQVSHLIASAINKEHKYNQGYVKWTANALLNYAKHELEKQGEQKPTNKVEPKFKVGDFIVNDYCIGKIITLNDNAYLLDNGQSIPFSCEDNIRLWTIKDVKDGDIIASHKIIILFKKFLENGSDCSYVTAYGGIDIFGKLQITDGDWMISNDTKPASKEQRDILFSKMKKAGYKWDAEKKELKKIKQKPVELTEICNYLECQKREESSRKNILDKWIVFLKSLNIEEAATKGAMVQINRVLNVLDWAEKKGRLSYSDWEDCYTIVASLKYRLKKIDTNKN